MKCKYCGGELYLEPRQKDEPILTQPMVALKCKDCGKFIKWCPKDIRIYYMNNKNDLTLEKLNAKLNIIVKYMETLLDINNIDYKQFREEIKEL